MPGVTRRTRYARLATERANPTSLDLDRLSAREIARLMNREDARAVRAVGRVVPRPSERLVPSMRQPPG